MCIANEASRGSGAEYCVTVLALSGTYIIKSLEVL